MVEDQEEEQKGSGREPFNEAFNRPLGVLESFGEVVVVGRVVVGRAVVGRVVVGRVVVGGVVVGRVVVGGVVVGGVVEVTLPVRITVVGRGG